MNKQEQYSTAIGGLFSLFIGIIVLLISIQNIGAFLTKSQMNAVQTQLFDSNPDLIDLDQSNFMMALAIDQTNFTTSPYFNITLKQTNQTRLPNGTIIKLSNTIPLIPCTLDRFQAITTRQGVDFSQTFQKVQLQTFLCPDYNQTIKLGGTYTSDSFNYLKVDVIACSNSSTQKWKPVCATPQAIQQYFNQNGAFKIELYLLNQNINPNYPGPNYLQPFLDDSIFFTFVPQKISVNVNIYIKKFLFNNDQSLLPYQDVQNLTVNAYTHRDYDVLTNLGQPSDTSFSQFYFRRSQFTIQNNRQYMKVQDLLSFLGGIIQIFLVLAGLIVIYYNKLQMYNELANKLFKFKLSDQEHSNSLETLSYLNKLEERQRMNIDDGSVVCKTHRIDIINRTRNDTIQQEPLLSIIDFERVEIENDIIEREEQWAFTHNCKKIQDYIYKKFEGILKRQKYFHITLKILINDLTFGKVFDDDDAKLIRNAMDRVTELLDVRTILYKLNEIERIKDILFNNQQREIFNNSPKEVITLETHKPNKIIQSKHHIINLFQVFFI